MKSIRKTLTWLLITLTTAALAYAVFRQPPVPVEVSPLHRTSLRVTVNEEGQTRIKDRYTVSAPLAGQLQRVKLKAGDTVEADKTVLAVILPADADLLSPRARAQAEARVKAAQAAQSQAQARHDQAQATHRFAKEDLDRLHRLKTGGAISQRDLDNAELREQSSANELKAAEFAQQIATFELEQAQAALDIATTTSNSSRRLEVKAPISGKVLRVHQESASFVVSGTALLDLGDPAELEIVVDVLSDDGVKISPGAAMDVLRWGGDSPLQARVRLVEPAAFLKVSALGVEEQRVNVVADFTSPPESRRALGDAFRVEAAITVWQGSKVLTLPTAALFRQGDRWACFVTEGGVARLRRLEIGHSNDREAEVLSGLADDDRVILSPSDRVVEGAKLVEKN